LIPRTSPKVNDVYLEEIDSEVLLTIEHADQTKYSAVLRGNKNDEEQIELADSVINMVRQALSMWSSRRAIFAERYIADDRKQIEFLNDVVAISRYLSNLPSESEILLKIGDGTLLMHNRIIAQLLYEYHKLDYDIDPRPANSIGEKVHDFNVSEFRCEVKTIQILGELEKTVNRTVRLSTNCERSLILKIRENLDEAISQVGNDGIIIFAPWSYRLNAVLRSYFQRDLALFPPVLAPGMSILVLTSNLSFQDYYIWFPTSLAKSFFENTFSMIQGFGAKGFSINYMKRGIPIRVSTSPVAGSTAGFIFQPEPWW
jgi:hypothetical protein